MREFERMKLKAGFPPPAPPPPPPVGAVTAAVSVAPAVSNPELCAVTAAAAGDPALNQGTAVFVHTSPTLSTALITRGSGSHSGYLR